MLLGVEMSVRVLLFNDFFLCQWCVWSRRWNTHVNTHVALKLWKANGIISKIWHYAPLQVWKLVYYRIFYSHLYTVHKTLSVDFSHSYNTCASAQGLINMTLKDTSTYSFASIKNQSTLSWNKLQKWFPKTKFDCKLKETLTSGFIKDY